MATLIASLAVRWPAPIVSRLRYFMGPRLHGSPADCQRASLVNPKSGRLQPDDQSVSCEGTRTTPEVVAKRGKTRYLFPAEETLLPCGASPTTMPWLVSNSFIVLPPLPLCEMVTL